MSDIKIHLVSNANNTRKDGHQNQELIFFCDLGSVYTEILCQAFVSTHPIIYHLLIFLGTMKSPTASFGDS